MEPLYSVKDLAERWRCTERTARERMRKIGTIGKPMLCREGAIVAWERQQERIPVPGIPSKRRRSPMHIEQGPLKPGQIISRVRPTGKRG